MKRLQTGEQFLVTKIAERRSSHRFSLRLPIKCRRTEPLSRFRTDVSEVLNISSKGLVFTTTEAFQPGQSVEASIEWPVLLDSHVRLTLVVEGEVVRKVGDQTAIRFEKHEFKTRRVG